MTLPQPVRSEHDPVAERSSSYVLRGGTDGALRLRRLARAKWPSTRVLLGRAGMRRGMRCLDVGCGPGDVALEMARVVGPEGEVVGIDADASVLETARIEAARRDARVRFRVGDAAAIDEPSIYDLVFARFVLTHVRHPETALAGMIAATRPGGMLVVEDIDFEGHVCFPPCRAFTRYVELYREVVRLRGGDADIGRRVFHLVRAAGAEDVQVDITQPAYATGDGKLMAQITMEHIRESVVGAALAAHAEVDAIIADLDAYAQDPGTIMSMPRIFQVWGQRPATRTAAGDGELPA